jgi:hypothetical protein
VREISEVLIWRLLRLASKLLAARGNRWLAASDE